MRIELSRESIDRICGITRVVDLLIEDTQKLYDRMIKGGQWENQINEFISSPEGLDDWTKRLFLLEGAIGGFGAHNANILRYNRDNENYSVTGTYQTDERFIFRPIQYCAAVLLSHFIALDTRSLVRNSCGHIESILKAILKSLSTRHRTDVPMGAVINVLSGIEDFQEEGGIKLLDKSRDINMIYRRAKHDFVYDPIDLRSSEPPLDLNTHLFTYEEAAITYFGCRIHGIELMEWMRERGFEPKSLRSLPRMNMEDYEAVVAHFSYNIRHRNPDLVQGGGIT